MAVISDSNLWNRSVPRYTSYPTAPQFYPIDESELKKKLAQFDQSKKPLSIYIHIPFCKTMCLFCGCSVVLNRKPERQTAYLRSLMKEIDLYSSKKREVSQLHFGGGTPTSLSEEEFAELMEKIRDRFTLQQDAEISIEIDPRTAGSEKLRALKAFGFNRVSFGVQDLDPAVQEAVKRRQSEEMTVQTFQMAKEIGFNGINIDLIYGLPLQTPESFQKTAEKLVRLSPDRIAFYSYAKVPWLKEHQKAIKEEDLPTADEKLEIYLNARKRFLDAGYIQIGMDHFSKPNDAIAIAYKQGKLTRNFQGYSVNLAEDMLGLGLSSIGFLENGYFQNAKDLNEYQARVERGQIPVERGFLLKEDDLIRKWAIQSIMCHFKLDKRKFFETFGLEFDLYFPPRKELEGLIVEDENEILCTGLGQLFVRLVAASFDAYLGQGQYSKVI
ncbi:MAG: oxygen-independent coproporphyrinogen III oxidase [Chlamydiae bacterium RIFCSPHIGHO2_12_FULL_49_9]|nr:MAG: oxygen-independent coproporphyrinogen III oxidase [Chlamydiae bacterium RIFCSPHIGHO2_12_FULL_49_9]